jgi:hypothetical protein
MKTSHDGSFILYEFVNNKIIKTQKHFEEKYFEDIFNMMM